MLGVKFNNRESVHGPMKVVLTPNIGLERVKIKTNRKRTIPKKRKKRKNR